MRTSFRFEFLHTHKKNGELRVCQPLNASMDMRVMTSASGGALKARVLKLRSLT